MFKAIGQMFAAIFTIFAAAERGANALNELAGIAESEAKGLADQMTIERQARQAELKAELSKIKAA